MATNGQGNQQHNLTEEPNASWRADRVLWAIIALAAMLALGYNFVMMVGFGPDEPRHMAYVRLLFEERRLPFQLPDGLEYAGAHTFHPPLYYIFLLPFYAIFRWLPGDVVWHVLRALSGVLCVVCLPLLYDIALHGAHGRRNIARLAVSLVALSPMFGMTAGTINNDSACLFAVTLFLWLLAVKYPHERSLKAAMVLGICFGLGALTKATAIACNSVALLLYLLAQDGLGAWRLGSTWRRLAIVLGVGAFFALPWHARSARLYGSWTPLPPAMPSPALPSPSNGALVMMMHSNFPAHFALANTGLFITLWSQKDWIPSPLRTPVYLTLALFCASGISGLVVRRRTSKEPPSARGAGNHEAARRDDVSARIACWCSLAAFVVAWLTVLQVALFMHWGWAEGGRYLVPCFFGFTLAVARGWGAWMDEIRLRLVVILCGVLLLALNAVAIFWLLSYLNPTFRPH